MAEEELRKMARKGTTSCMECRRRKLRCIRDPEGVLRCRRCEERGSECTPQTYSSQPRHAHGLPSRHRISQLEAQVAGLTKAVQAIESRLGYQITQHSTPVPAPPEPKHETDESDEDSTISEVLGTEQPSQLRSLFHNDWISINPNQDGERCGERKVKESAHLLDLSRKVLQKLIPPKEDIAGLVKFSSSSSWLELFHTLLPHPYAARSEHELCESYNGMLMPDVDAIRLASWLLTIAITVQQIPGEYYSPTARPRNVQKYSRFSRAVAEAVERTILLHERLLCSPQGVGMGMNYCRLQLSLGNFQKAWLRLRSIVGIATLMGLPKASQVVQFNRANGITSDEIQLHEAQLWETLCFAGGLSGMINNLPPSISPYQQIQPQTLVVDGVVQPREYLCRLTGLITKIQYRDDLSVAQGSCPELHTSTLDLDRQIRVLASEVPRSWWTVNEIQIDARHVAQFFHNCVLMRIHLPFAMRQDPNEEYIYNLLTCRDTCEEVATRYQFIRAELPCGIFLGPVLDLQAFIATVVLLLTSKSSASRNLSNLRINKDKTDKLVAQVVKTMDEKSAQSGGSNFGQHSVTAIRSLTKLLQQDEKAPNNDQELTLRIPLLGKIRIRPNIPVQQTFNFNKPTSAPVPPDSELPWRPDEHVTLQKREQMPLDSNSHVASQSEMHQGWQWEPLTWSAGDHYNQFFQDVLMGEGLDQLGVLQNNYQFNEFEFISG
ncbi:putative Zn(II)2Cys6 transcription factor [Xylogone sp. PMI_703]|nr:putative Zn(II)2Cys6 transcription factor [Xylogone sp. PMI_703]